MKVETRGSSSHVHKIERPLGGEKRRAISEYLQGKSVNETFYRSLNNASNPVHSIDVLKKVKSEVKLSERLDQDPILDLFAEKVRGSPQYVRDIGLSPFFVFFWLEESLQFVKKLKDESFTLHLDATGSVMKPISISTQPIFYYALVIKRDEISEKSFSVADMLSETHSVPRIQFFLREWIRNVNKPIRPKCVVTDCSFALMHATVIAFNASSLSDDVQLRANYFVQQHFLAKVF